MSGSDIYWPNVGWVVMAACLIIFLSFALRRRWTIGALLVGLLHLPIALTHAVAPIRGVLDPTYPGYLLGLVHADKGVEVAMFAFVMLAGGLICACIAVLNRPGERNYFIAAFDAMLLTLLAPATLAELAAGDLSRFRVEFGHYLQFGGLSAFLFESALLLAAPLIGLAWALRRARAG